MVLTRNGHRPDESHVLRPPKLVLEGALSCTFPPPPPKIARYVLPPPFANSPKKGLRHVVNIYTEVSGILVSAVHEVAANLY